MDDVAKGTTDFLNFMLNKRCINVTVTYKDGTKETKQLVMKAKCVPYIDKYKKYDDMYVDKYGERDIYRFDKIEVSAKLVD